MGNRGTHGHISKSAKSCPSRCASGEEHVQVVMWMWPPHSTGSVPGQLGPFFPSCHSPAQNSQIWKLCGTRGLEFSFQFCAPDFLCIFPAPGFLTSHELGVVFRCLFFSFSGRSGSVVAPLKSSPALGWGTFTGIRKPTPRLIRRPL